MNVTVVVPWASGCPHRETAWEWVQSRYEDAHPEWRVVTAELAAGPWVKAKAVTRTLDTLTAELVVIADADVWCDQLDRAVTEVAAGAPWAVPHGKVRRLNERSTSRVLAGEGPERLQLEEPSYMGAMGGGVIVLPRKTALEIPFDPRFVGWGGEDRAWGWALNLLAGHPWRGSAILWHLWHPAQERTDRNHGSAATEALRKRYRDARQNESAMRMLIEEARHGA